jgi:hypothetical protein
MADEGEEDEAITSVPEEGQLILHPPAPVGSQGQVRHVLEHIGTRERATCPEGAFKLRFTQDGFGYLAPQWKGATDDDVMYAVELLHYSIHSLPEDKESERWVQDRTESWPSSHEADFENQYEPRYPHILLRRPLQGQAHACHKVHRIYRSGLTVRHISPRYPQPVLSEL